jgi:hypothetical protein
MCWSRPLSSGVPLMSTCACRERGIRLALTFKPEDRTRAGGLPGYVPGLYAALRCVLGVALLAPMGNLPASCNYLYHDKESGHCEAGCICVPEGGTPSLCPGEGRWQGVCGARSIVAKSFYTGARCYDLTSRCGPGRRIVRPACGRAGNDRNDHSKWTRLRRSRGGQSPCPNDRNDHLSRKGRSYPARKMTECHFFTIPIPIADEVGRGVVLLVGGVRNSRSFGHWPARFVTDLAGAVSVH